MRWSTYNDIVQLGIIWFTFRLGAESMAIGEGSEVGALDVFNEDLRQKTINKQKTESPIMTYPSTLLQTSPYFRVSTRDLGVEISIIFGGTV
jgi:hypothetical protein